MLLARRVDERPAGVVERERVLDAFRRAIAIDPWNPLAYVAMADFVRRHGDGLRYPEGDASDALLLKALALDPTYVPAIDRLVEIHVSRGRLGDAYALLRNVVFPWLELLKRRDDGAAARYLAQMQTLAERAGDSAFLAALSDKRQTLANVRPTRHRTWFDATQPRESGSGM
jgi:Tfp pilus assembly protein PilF